jgi:hypothetical protein
MAAAGFVRSGILLFLCLTAGFLPGQVDAKSPLFSSHSVMELTIPLDFKTLCRPRETPDCDYTPTVLEYENDQGRKHSIPIEVRIRGGWRSLTKNCSAPLLFIRFSEQGTTGTPFEHQDLLPLTTHCGQGLSLESAHEAGQRHSTWEQYLLREYLVHRLYNVLTDFSLKARLVHMTYPNPDKPGRKIRNYAFFTEHFKSMAGRTSTELLPRGSFDAEILDARSADVHALFQFMIGNTDWSIVRQRNIILVRQADGTHVPAPYDFDMSGLVDAHYAGPAPGLPINDVRKRYYLGFCHPETNWDALFTTYLEKQATLQTLVADVPDLNKKSRKSVNRYLEKFFDILHSDEERTEHIVQACQTWPPSRIDHLTPNELR